MRLASAQICHGTVNNCITWNGAHLVLLHGVMLQCVCVCGRVGVWLQPQLAGNGVTSHALNYCTFVAGRQSAAKSDSEHQHCGFCHESSVNSHSLSFSKTLSLCWTSFTTISHTHICKHGSLSLFFSQLTKTYLSYYLFMPFALLTHRVYTTAYTDTHTFLYSTRTNTDLFTQFNRQLIFMALLTEACLLSQRRRKKNAFKKNKKTVRWLIRPHYNS